MDSAVFLNHRPSKQRELLHRTLNSNLPTLSKRRQYSDLTFSTRNPVSQMTEISVNDTNTGINSPILQLNETELPKQSFPPSRASRVGKEHRPHPSNKISNFFDKEQIKNAIEEINISNQKVKFIDFVIKRRKEIKDLEDQNRLERVTPLLKRFSGNYRKRRAGFIADPALSSSFSTVLKKPVDSIVLPNGREDTESQENIEKEKKTEDEKLASLIREKMRLFLIRSNNDQQRDSPDQFSTLIEPKRIERFGAVRSNRHTSRLAALRNKIKLGQKQINLGSQTLEGDLYKFLLKNEDKKNSSVLMFDSNNSKCQSIRKIENKAAMKFDSYKEQRRHKINYLKENHEVPEVRRDKNKSDLNGYYIPKNSGPVIGSFTETLERRMESPKGMTIGGIGLKSSQNYLE